MSSSTSAPIPGSSPVNCQTDSQVTAAVTDDVATATEEVERLRLGRRYRRGEVTSGLTHECGVFGAIASDDWPTKLRIAETVCYGLISLQHRGQESAGIVTSEGKGGSQSFNVVKGMGMVGNVFTDEHVKRLRGNLGIGHTRYSTSAASDELHCQPFVVHTTYGAMAVAHNGEMMEQQGFK